MNLGHGQDVPQEGSARLPQPPGTGEMQPAIAGGHPLPVWSYSLRREQETGRVPALNAIAGRLAA